MIRNCLMAILWVILGVFGAIGFYFTLYCVVGWYIGDLYDNVLQQFWATLGTAIALLCFCLHRLNDSPHTTDDYQTE